ncbi:MAG: response regulator transcription factor [Rhodoferax sp.]|uniref:LytR/AlgR family response regulator transcription factor n=1 Tax=Rhodoferax sp. TaxID=50421 RepID=UPI001B6E3307|nr:LytTR family DNA-binding domain-containing protein [Rhodoferax sp.]MBP9906386.1 response regulator transcription factor [Rhodoferax sp.]
MNTRPQHPTALIAEDEPLLAAALKAELVLAWPELKLLATVADGGTAVREALALQPDVLFFDIRMPGMGGLEAAAELADLWDNVAKPFPALVFVTAYDQYALQAFEAQAMDYLLKPLNPARLQKTVAKLRGTLALRSRQNHPPQAAQGADTQQLDTTMAQLRELLQQAERPGPGPGGTWLKLLQVGVGNSVRLVPIDDVLYFEAADKYIRVLTAQHEYLIRTPLKELLPQLDPDRFWQVHRGTVVNSHCIESASRDESGKTLLRLRGLPGKLTVSRLYAGLFKAM